MAAVVWREKTVTMPSRARLTDELATCVSDVDELDRLVRLDLQPAQESAMPGALESCISSFSPFRTYDT